MNRLCIYLTYDRQKIADRYIGYMLKELKTCVNCLIVVCNQRELLRGANILEEYADEIFYRDNIGFDAGAFKDALCRYMGWDEILKYDELVLVNDSLFGPFKPMRDIFSEMEQKPFDFWGLSGHGEGVNSFVGYVQEHIQSFFLVIRSRLLHSREFRDYWEDMPYFTSFRETIICHEVGFTRYFSGMGYTCGTLADTKANDSENYLNNYSQYSRISYEMIKKRNFPFFKKKPVTYNTLYCQTQQNLRQSIDYIDRETSYDIGLVWENLIRTCNIADLQRSLHLQYIISAGQEGEIAGQIAVVIFVAYRESAEYVLEYVQRLNPKWPVSIIARTDECLEDYQGYGFLCRKAGEDEGIGLLQEFSGYDFVCVLHDTDMTSAVRASCTGKSYFFNIWENLLRDSRHVAGVAHCFAEEPYLGFLAPPQPNFGEYFQECGKGWDGKYGTVSRIVEETGLYCQVSEEKAPYRVTDNFWIRGGILGKLGDIKKEDALYLSYIWSYLAQDAGYYSGIVEDVEYASMNEVNLNDMLCSLASQVRQQCGGFIDYNGMQERMKACALKAFCGRYARIIIYGAGEEARKYRGIVPDIEAYVVSDGQTKPDEIEGIQVKFLSEMETADDCGIVLLLNRENQKQVIPLLEARGIRNYFCT